MAQFIIVNTKKGGTLKTTISTNLASLIALNSKRVLLVDIDAQSDVAISFNINTKNQEHTIYDCLYNDVPTEDCIVSYNDNLDLLLSDDRMEEYEFDILTNPEKLKNYKNVLQDAISQVADDYDYIIFDTSPSASILEIQYLMLDSNNGKTTDIIMPFQPEVYAMKNLMKQINKINRFKQSDNKNLNIKAVIPTKVSNNNTHRMVVTQTKLVLDSQDIKMTDIQIKNTVKFSEYLLTNNKPLSLEKDEDLLAEFVPFKEIYKDLLAELKYA